MKGTRFSSWVLAMLGAAFLMAVPAHAGLIVAVDSIFAVAGSSGSLDVTLTNTGPTSLSIGSFGFIVSTPDTDITFLSTDNSTTDPYIFPTTTAGTQINFIFTTPGQSMDGSDFAADLAGITLAANSTVGLGRVLFQVAPGAVLGVAPVNLDSTPGNVSVSASFNDGGADYSGITLDSGQINVTTPEPATIALLGTALLGVVGLRKRAIGRR